MSDALLGRGVTLSPRSVRRHLRQMNARYIRSCRTLKHKQDTVKVKQSRDSLDNLKKKSAQGKLTLAFVDECGFSPSQPVNYSWAVWGERKYVPYENPNRRRMNVMAAMMSDGRSGTLVWSKQPRPFRSEEFVKFLTRTFSEVNGLKVVVVDNYSIHRSKVVKEACGSLRRAGIVLYYLPPYSPELNDIEGVFGAIKHHDMPERAYKSLDELGEAIDSAFGRADRRLKSRYEYQLRPAA